MVAGEGQGEVKDRRPKSEDRSCSMRRTGTPHRPSVGLRSSVFGARRGAARLACLDFNQRYACQPQRWKETPMLAPAVFSLALNLLAASPGPAPASMATVSNPPVKVWLSSDGQFAYGE